MRHATLKLSLVTMAVVILSSLSGCGSSPAPKPDNDSPETKQAAAEALSDPPVVNPRDIPAGRHLLLVPLKVQSNPPGGVVFIGGEVVRGEGETLAQTPLEVLVPHGELMVSVERPGGRRVTQRVKVPDVDEVEFDLGSAADESDKKSEPTPENVPFIEATEDSEEPSLLNAPYFQASVGRPLELKSINSPGKDFDPFVSADGKSIWFASDRGGVRGVYTATRVSPYHDFETPQAIPASSGADLPASPSVTADGLMLIYAVPEKARLWQLNRLDTTTPFDNKEIIRTDEQSSRAWRSAQLSSDGLRLYWTEEGDDRMLTRAAVRSSTGKLFGKTLTFDLPEHHPHLSSDGLRHFTFDGSTLHRARRGSIKQPFGEPEVIGQLKLDNYQASPRHRQFWVTEDEQWLFYCDDPRSGGDLFLVRLSDGPTWGRAPQGKSIAAKVMVAKIEEEKPKVEKPVEPQVDPRSLPLPYTTHWTELSKLVTAGQTDEALALARKSLTAKALADNRTLVTWDIELVEHVAEFHRDVTQALEALKPGAIVRVGGARLEFERREGDELHLKLRDKPVLKKISELAPGDLVALADAGPDKADAAKALRIGIYLHFQGKLMEKVSESWLKRGLGEGENFVERLAARLLIQGQQEIARSKYSEGIGFLDEVIAVAPASDAAKQATKERATLYDKLTWKPVGNRKWKRGEQGEYLSDPARSSGSYLMSEQQYGNFELSCEWKVTGSTAMGGVYLRYDGRGNPFENGAKIHLANDAAQRGVDQYSTGSLFGSDPPLLNAGLGDGKWNTLRIRTRDKQVQVAINGKDVLKATLGADVPAEGFVVLDGVAGGISYRKVVVYELPAGE